jgi:hypothetical protein
MCWLPLRGFNGSLETMTRGLLQREDVSFINPNAIGDRYDDLIGTWSDEEPATFGRKPRLDATGFPVLQQSCRPSHTGPSKNGFSSWNSIFAPQTTPSSEKQ